MTLYIESSAYAKRYLPDEEHHAECLGIMNGDAEWVTSRLTSVETARALVVMNASRIGAANVIGELDADLMETVLFDIDRVTLSMAREVALTTGAKTLDSIHIATALRISDDRPRFLTYDAQQARAAAEVGLTLAR